MEITFIGTGEACDKNRRNTSILLTDESGHHLLDCGFSSAHGYLRLENKKVLKTIWISHFHGDHFFGVPQLIVHYYMQNRKEPLTICSGIDCQGKIISAINLAYAGLSEKLPFTLTFVKVPPGEKVELNGLHWQSATVNHSQSAFSIKIDNGACALYYSGDGKPTDQALELLRSCDIVIHEAFSIRPSKPSHASIEECLTIAKNHKIPHLALIHISQQAREELSENSNILQIPQKTNLFIPDDGDSLRI